MNSEAHAAWTLLIYSTTMTVAILLGMTHSGGWLVKGVLAFGLALTLMWSLGPTLFRLLSSGRH